ncbi:hypothetical protein CDAR_391061 [Caerostris darwini]|uniref:Uncharacterized protein n=1 Tax=Caerostris darwini TaxID=1538125 RepID=A0AAV4UAN0_9ARAC|nr:hypothetical protein CDAR_391061 [Caerostris darwini]
MGILFVRNDGEKAFVVINRESIFGNPAIDFLQRVWTNSGEVKCRWSSKEKNQVVCKGLNANLLSEVNFKKIIKVNVPESWSETRSLWDSLVVRVGIDGRAFSPESKLEVVKEMITFEKKGQSVYYFVHNFAPAWEETGLGEFSGHEEGVQYFPEPVRVGIIDFSNSFPGNSVWSCSFPWLDVFNDDL